MRNNHYLHQHNISKFIGCTMIIIGTAIGAGMLALPIISAIVGFKTTVFLTTFLWLLATITALLTLEVTLAFSTTNNNSYGTMSRETIGRHGEIIAWISCLILLYSLTAAYIAGNTSLLSNLLASALNWHIPNWINALIFIVTLGGVVFWSTRAVDYFNRWLLSVKGILLCGVLILLIPHIDTTTLFNQHVEIKYIFAIAPIFLCSFGFHTIIPSLSNYFGYQKKPLRAVIITGSTITFIIYILWLLITLGTIPLESVSDSNLITTNSLDHGNLSSFNALAKAHGSVGELIKMLTLLAHSNWITISINGFANIAMTTSFLGVSLSLFDLLADGCKRQNNKIGRFQTALLTFIPPLLFVLFYPQGFIIALGYASIFVAIIIIILPALMAYKLRRNSKLQTDYNVKINNLCLFFIMGIGVALITLQLFSTMHFLPSMQ